MVHLLHEMKKEEDFLPDSCNLCILELEAMAYELIYEQLPIFPTNKKEYPEIKKPRKAVEKKSER